MADEWLHIRRTYQIEGDRRWALWSAVLVKKDGQEIIASTQPLEKLSPPPYSRLMLTEDRDLPSVYPFEHEMQVTLQGKELVAALEKEGWEAMERDATGQVVRMRRRKMD